MLKIAPSITNNFYRVSRIKYVVKLQLECLDIKTQQWTGVTKEMGIAPISGCYITLLMIINEHAKYKVSGHCHYELFVFSLKNLE